MARKRASMREGPLAELFKATEAAQRQAEGKPLEAVPEAEEPAESTVEHVQSWEEERAPVQEVMPEEPLPLPEPPARPAREPGPPVPEPTTPPFPQPPEPRPPDPIPAARYLEALPEPPPRLHRVPRADSASYLAVIRVVGVGGAG